MSDDQAPKRSGSETRQRQAVVSIRYTTEEYDVLKAAAQRVGLTVGAFMRQQCLGTPGPRAGRRPVVEREMLAKALAQLGKCGGNLNQIARALNSGGGNTGEIPDAVAEFRAVCADIMHALGKRSYGADAEQAP